MSLLVVNRQVTSDANSLTPLDALNHCLNNGNAVHLFWLQDEGGHHLLLHDEMVALEARETPNSQLLKNYRALYRKAHPSSIDRFAPIFHLLHWWRSVEEPSTLLTLFEAWRSEVGSIPPTVRSRLLTIAAQLYERVGQLSRSRTLLDKARKLSAPDPSTVSATLRRARRARSNPGSDFEIHCFGGAIVSIKGEPVEAADWRTRKALSLCLYLALEVKEASADQLQEVIWPGRGPENRRNFQTTISRIRKTLKKAGWQGELVRSKSGLYKLSPRTDDTSKVRFERGFRELVTGRFSLEKAREIVALHQGPYLAGLEDLWVLNARRRHLNQWFGLAEKLFQAELDLGNLEEAEVLTGRMLSLDGARESAHLCKIQSLFSQRRVREAGDAYRLFQRVLKKSAGTKPSQRATDLFRTWKRQAQG